MLFSYDERELIKQLDLFHNAKKMFGMDITIQMRNKKQLRKFSCSKIYKP